MRTFLARRLRFALVAGLSVAVVTACGGDDGGRSPSASGGADGNYLQNAGFEEGDEPWYGLGETADTNFMLSDAQALSGTQSALEHMRDTPEDTGSGTTNSKVYYLVQEINPAEFPDVVRGSYYVENWNKGTFHQYVQFVLIAFGPDNFPDTVENWQIRFPLAGIDSQPFAIGNAKFKFINKEEPVEDEWVPFEIHVKDDFEELWGMAPEGFEGLRLLFEVRWDNKQAGSGAPQADVYWDDLYAGPD